MNKIKYKKVNWLEYDETNEIKKNVIERKTKRGRRGTKNKRAPVAQQGCQVQSGVGRQDSQGAVTGGESWETCVSCLPRLQTTSLCFTGPFFPSTHRQPPPPSTLHHPEKNTTGLPQSTCREGLQTEEEMVGEKQKCGRRWRQIKCTKKGEGEMRKGKRTRRGRKNLREGRKNIEKKKESDKTQLWNLKRKQWQQTQLLSGMG